MKNSEIQLEKKKMPNSEFSDSEYGENVSSEEETEAIEATPNNEGKLSEYERQRLKRIEENKKRMEALGLQKVASSFNSSVEKTQKKKVEKKGKKKMANEDEEYNPVEDDEETSSSAEEDGKENDFSLSGKKKVKKNTSTPKKRGPAHMLSFESDFVDDDDALMQAIALSLQDSAGFLDVKRNSPSQSSGSRMRNIAASETSETRNTPNDRKNNFQNQDDSEKRKRKKVINSRVQMSEDEMLIHFFQFDETGRGGINLKDLTRLAMAHDFTWSEKELADMIYCFDSDGDGKINLDDFRKIVIRCNMLKGPDNDTTS